MHSTLFFSLHNILIKSNLDETTQTTMSDELLHSQIGCLPNYQLGAQIKKCLAYRAQPEKQVFACSDVN